MKYFVFCLFSLSLLIAEEDATPASLAQDVAKISEAFGHLIGKKMSSMGLELDVASVIKGMQNEVQGAAASMTETECIQLISQAQEAVFQEQSSSNLAKAEAFLQQNAKEIGIVSLEEGKVQYKIDSEGQGDTLAETSSPLIRYVGKFLDGTIFGQSSEDEPISLENMIPGLKAGMIGMAQGEKRTIYIHPDLAYGTMSALPPNSLLTFEIEVIQTQAPAQDTPSSVTNGEHNAKIALPELEQVQ